MKNKLQSEFYSVSSLSFSSSIVVTERYALVIRPRAVASLQREYALARTDPTIRPGRSIYVIVKDYEQETCIILMIWSLTCSYSRPTSCRATGGCWKPMCLHVPETCDSAAGQS